LPPLYVFGIRRANVNQQRIKFAGPAEKRQLLFLADLGRRKASSR
jgi:hypothetical protein